MEKVNIHRVLEHHAENAVRRGFNKLPHISSGTQDARQIIDEHPWGTYGKDGKSPIKVKKLAELDTDHLKNILRTEVHITTTTMLAIVAILLERDAFEKISDTPKKSKSKTKMNLNVELV